MLPTLGFGLAPLAVRIWPRYPSEIPVTSMICRRLMVIELPLLAREVLAHSPLQTSSLHEPGP